jgi:hypothetical protein
MMRSVVVYGFGSAFDDGDTANDIDLLILHESADAASCGLAIECKKQLADRLTRAHITMLSVSEEKHFGFIHTARAVCLGMIREDNILDGVELLYVDLHVGVLSHASA